ncbi:MAG: hypothetical protein CSB47_08420 [Proteobacteria bacterium]|nr:MAG: hypothetical protein CSB47_08420 [Pseudomonadota bacterium]
MQSYPKGLPLEEFLTYRVNVLSNLLNRRSERFLRRNYGISIPDWRVLVLLANHGPMFVRDLAGMSRTDKAQVSRVVNRLAALGLVNSEADPYDARLVEVSITKVGMDLFNNILPKAIVRQSALLAVLEPDEWQVLDRVLEKLTEFAEEEGGASF